MFREIFGGSLVKDARVTSQGPEILFKNEFGLWVPTTWTEFYWFKYRTYFYLLFGLVVIAIGLWHRWDVNRSHDQT